MKQQANNEMDLLLRRLSRQDGGSARGGQAPIDEQHLDADELSAYAQNALPPTTRTRYTEHLADCSTCRKLVTELSLSLGAATVAAPVETVHGPGGLKKFLAGLLSPLVLRYAVPALGVIVVMVIGFVVLRQQKRQEFVARVDEQEQRPPLTKQTETPATAGKEIPEPPAAPNTRPDDSLQAETGSARDRVSKPAEAKPESKSGAGAGTAEPAPVTKNEKSVDDRATIAPTPTPPAAPKAAATAESEEQKKADVIAKNQPEPQVQRAKVAEQEAKSRGARDVFRRVEPIANERVEQSKEKEKAAPSPSVGFLGGTANVAKARRQEVKVEGTRTIEGRRFRKERGIWIDTAYDSSTAIVNVARGSEQYRGLVADEPAIDTIAKQLDGEVIVVWKGHAYRIR
jgi:cytoskeletal protein RodZ